MLRYILAILVVLSWADLPVQGGTCYGLANCTACKNCKYCRNCNSGGTPCGVWNATNRLRQLNAETITRPVVDTPARVALPAHSMDFMPPTAPPIQKGTKAKITEYRSKPKTAASEDPFVANVRRRIAQSWGTYPGCDLTARIYFEVNQSGDLVNLKVLSASGDPDGITQAVDAIKCSTPFGTPLQTERFVVNFKDGQMDYSSEVQRFQTTSIKLAVPKSNPTAVPPALNVP